MTRAKIPFIITTAVMVVSVTVITVLSALYYHESRNPTQEEIRIAVNGYYAKVTDKDIEDVKLDVGPVDDEKESAIRRIRADRSVCEDMTYFQGSREWKRNWETAIREIDLVLQDLEMNKVDAWTARVASKKILNVNRDTEKLYLFKKLIVTSVVILIVDSIIMGGLISYCRKWVVASATGTETEVQE